MFQERIRSAKGLRRVPNHLLPELTSELSVGLLVQEVTSWNIHLQCSQCHHWSYPDYSVKDVTVHWSLNKGRGKMQEEKKKEKESRYYKGEVYWFFGGKTRNMGKLSKRLNQNPGWGSLIVSFWKMDILLTQWRMLLRLFCWSIFAVIIWIWR